MYIIDMRYGNNIKKIDMTPTEILVGIVIPFILFWGGILSPVFSDILFVWVLSLIPFYGFVFLCVFAMGKKSANVMILSSLMNLLTSVILAFFLFLIPQDWIVFGNMCRVSLVNLVPAFIGVFFCATNGFVESIKGTPFPVFPFFIL